MIYFDNASTTFPKAPGVSSGVKQFIDRGCFNINRGAYAGARNISELVFETRDLLAAFFSVRSSKNVVFTGGLTQSLNMALKGMLRPGDRVLTSVMEHNAVMRPLKQLEKTGIEIEYFECNSQGEADFEDFKQKIEKKPKLLVITHASNVCGTIMPIARMGELCRKNGVFFVVDAAQTAGTVKIDIQKDNIDIFCFTAHKGLLALQGLGGLIIGDGAAGYIEPLISGGTGSFSALAEIPRMLPDKLEAGTLNLPGIVGLNCSLKYLKEKGIDEIFTIEKNLQTYFESEIKKMPSIRLVAAESKDRCAVTSLDFAGKDSGEIAYRLDDEYGIMVRSGLHCAPAAHRTIGTFPQGTLRFSFGHTNTFEEVDTLLGALRSISG